MVRPHSRRIAEIANAIGVRLERIEKNGRGISGGCHILRERLPANAGRHSRVSEARAFKARLFACFSLGITELSV